MSDTSEDMSFLLSMIFGCQDRALPVDTATPVPCDVEPGTRPNQRFEHEGETRRYLLHVPASVRCGEPAPLLFDLHGTAVERPEEAYGLTAAIEASEADGFVLVRPRSRSSDEGGLRVYRWDQNPGDTDLNHRFLTALLDDLRARLPIDEAAIRAVGFSSGTNQVMRLARRRASPFSGFGLVGGGAWSIEEIRADGRFYLHTSWRDYMRRYHREAVALLDAAGVPDDAVFHRDTFAGHELYDWMYSELWDFLAAGALPLSQGGGDPRWTTVPGIPEGALAVTLDNADGWLAGTDGRLWRLRPEPWSAVAVDVVGEPSGPEAALTSVCMGAEGVGAAVGNGAVVWTLDAGQTWVHVDPVPEPGPATFGAAHWTGIACGDGGALGVGYWSAGFAEDGMDFVDVPLGTGAVRAQVQAVAQGPTGTWMTAGYPRWLARGRFEPDPVTVAGPGWWLLNVVPASEDVWIAVGDEGMILRSTDDGRSFDAVASFANVEWNAVAFDSPDVGLAVGSRGAAALSRDGGVTWSRVDLGADHLLTDVVWFQGAALAIGPRGAFELRP